MKTLRKIVLMGWLASSIIAGGWLGGKIEDIYLEERISKLNYEEEIEQSLIERNNYIGKFSGGLLGLVMGYSLAGMASAISGAGEDMSSTNSDDEIDNARPTSSIYFGGKW